jgi:hypothetical protein
MVFEIPQAELNLLKTGMAGEIEFRVLNEKLPLHISGISPLVKPLSGTASGELELGEISSKAREKLYPGMIGRALFKLNNRQGVVIAKDSVSFEKGKFQVRCVVDNHVVKKTVSLGKELDKKVEITSGLSAGEVLVLSASKYLKDNEEVKTEKGEPKHE